MTRGPRLYLVCYDIGDPKRLRNVWKIMRGRGERVQYSVYRCVLSPLQLEQLEDVLESIVHAQEDQVLIVPLGHAEKKRSWRMYTLGRPLPEPERTVQVF
ncbi:MAG: CRISPR-associated endonuclease Cas2 [Alphaproteobacteria bacterium]|nr:CRISPR-associated endonuclease Cas2 [Alphaproteobacteria bacterium]